MIVRIGFTGTQEGMTWKQGSAVQARLTRLSAFGQWPQGEPVQRHHGCCIGADEEFHNMRVERAPMIGLVLHPPLNRTKLSTDLGDLTNPHIIVLEAQEYMDRNHAIVDQTDVLWAAPHTMNEVVRSGTWATVRYARRVDKPIVIFWPDGTVTT